MREPSGSVAKSARNKACSADRPTHPAMGRVSDLP